MATMSPDQIDIIDDDIQHSVRNMLLDKYMFKFESQNDDSDDESPDKGDHLKTVLCRTLQAERNHWKAKLQSSLHEVDREHKAKLATQSSLQDLVAELGIIPHNNDEETYTNWGKSSDLITCIASHIYELKSTIEKTKKDPKVEVNIAKMKTALSVLQQEKKENLETIASQTKQIRWLHKELNSVKYQLHKLRDIVKNYNEAESSKFHLDEVVSPKLQRSPRLDPLGTERMYFEGEQLQYPSAKMEAEVWKARVKQQGRDSQKASPRVGISQCLRCQKLFKQGENSGLACRYHRKGREIREQYDETGRLSRVLYKWACCKKVLDTPGCTYGYHV